MKMEEQEKLKEETEREEMKEQQRREEEQRQREEEEYKKWESQLVLEEQGDQNERDAEVSNVVGRFIEFIRLRKSVEIQELAQEFGLTNRSVLQRLEDLQTSGEIRGVLDERGRFLCITDSEIEVS